GQGADLIAVDRLAARASLLIDPALLAGFAVAIAGTDRWGRMPLQIGGFLGCAAGLLLAAAGAGRGAGPAALPLLMAGLVLFQFMTNLGPNAQTYLLAGELFPTAMRGRAAGLAAATGKVAAVLSAFLLPLGLQRWGAAPLLVSLALSSLLGAAVTWRCRIETNGQALEDR
ncbi:MAG: MFS transporter, partial [Cyanobium sp.]